MEFQANIASNGVVLHVDFKGGHDNESGVTPASYQTTSTVVQHMIERSDLFLSGRIRLLEVEDLGESEEEKQLRLLKESVSTPEQQDKEDDVDHGKSHPDKTPEPEKTEKESDTPAADTECSNGEAKLIEVACRDDAKNYLVDNFYLKASNLRSKIAIEEAAATYGVKFIYPEG